MMIPLLQLFATKWFKKCLIFLLVSKKEKLRLHRPCPPVRRRSLTLFSCPAAAEMLASRPRLVPEPLGVGQHLGPPAREPLPAALRLRGVPPAHFEVPRAQEPQIHRGPPALPAPPAPPGWRQRCPCLTTAWSCQQVKQEPRVTLAALHPYRLPVEDVRVPPHESSEWPSSVPHFNLVSSYDLMVQFLGIGCKNC